MTVAERTHLDGRTAAYADEVIASIEAAVPVVEAFAVGSAAVGGFVPGASDLDLVVVVERALTTGEKNELLLRLRELDSPVRDLELVVYATGTQPPDFDLNVNRGEERPNAEPFWFVLDAAVARQHAIPLLRGRRWSELFEPIAPERVREAMHESLEWAAQRPSSEFARLHAARARHYLERGEWISKRQAREEAGR